MLQLSAALEAFDAHGLRAQNDRLIDIPDMITVLTALYEVTSDGAAALAFVSQTLHSLVPFHASGDRSGEPERGQRAAVPGPIDQLVAQRVRQPAHRPNTRTQL